MENLCTQIKANPTLDFRLRISGGIINFARFCFWIHLSYYTNSKLISSKRLHKLLLNCFSNVNISKQFCFNNLCLSSSLFKLISNVFVFIWKLQLYHLKKKRE